jgi:enoyl-CoA hydratase
MHQDELEAAKQKSAYLKIYETIETTIDDGVGTIRLNRPKALNALSSHLMRELTEIIDAFEQNDGVRVVVLMGSEKAFAAGADIKEMADKTYMDVYQEDFITATWERITRFRKPIMAAVRGYALGGGCELAMMCDFIIAADNAKFGQPEITIGTIPGAGGTQRLTRFVGKAKAMEMCLTGRMMSAEEAERAGLVSRVVKLDDFMDDVMETARRIASMSMPVAMMVKESVNMAYETTLHEGIHFERRLFHSTFAIEDQKEGMQAFIDKREAKFLDK